MDGEIIAGQHTKTLPSAPSPQPAEASMQRKQIAAVLAKLSLHYWRPDFSPEQAKLLMEDYLCDLAQFSPVDVERACMEYRRRPGSEFFPKVCQLLEILCPPKSEFDIPPRRLPTFRSADYLLPGPKPKLQSVGDVLRKFGHTAAAERYEAGK